MEDQSAVSSEARQVDGTLSKMILKFMRRALGQEAVDRVLEMAGQRRLAVQLDQPGAWTSTAETLALADAATILSGETDIGRRIGEELMRSAYKHGQVEFVRAAGSIVDALIVTTNGGTKMSTGRVMELVESGEDYATITGYCHNQADANRVWCGISAGYYGLVPGIFGAVGVITEPECQTRGDERCLYRLRWAEPEGPIAVGVDGVQIDASRERTAVFTERFAQLHTMATEFAEAERVDTLLERLTERAGLAIDAPRFLFAVRSTDGDRADIYQRGFSPDGAERFAQRLLSGELVEDGRCLVADIAVGGHTYGRLGALYPRGYLLSDWDRRLVSGYARHAAAALDAVASLETARRDRDTAQALLALANDLADVATADDVVERVAGAVPRVTACDQAGVWLWHETAQALYPVAEYPHVDPERIDPRLTLSVADVPELAELVQHPFPFLIGVEDAQPAVHDLMELRGMARCAVVPLRARGVFLGVVVAGFSSAGGDSDADLLRRLGGVADQAATALDNARLVDRIRDQALHDSLTGLANRALVEDRARQALSRRDRHGSCGVLFVDLDRFKNVNDSLGHEVGDELIKQAGLRLESCIRSGDTLARLGGDEFVLLIPELRSPDDAARVAEKILAEIERPFSLGADEVFMSCSIGIATAPDHGDDYATLLRHADSAMYQAKANGRNTYAVHTRLRTEPA